MKVGAIIKENAQAIADSHELSILTNKETTKKLLGINFAFLIDVDEKIDPNLSKRYYGEKAVSVSVGGKTYRVNSQWVEGHRSKIYAALETAGVDTSGMDLDDNEQPNPKTTKPKAAAKVAEKKEEVAAASVKKEKKPQIKTRKKGVQISEDGTNLSEQKAWEKKMAKDKAMRERPEVPELLPAGNITEAAAALKLLRSEM